MVEAVLVVACWWCVRAWKGHLASADAVTRRNAAIAARADQQHQWVMEGDERGVYGDYPPPNK